MSMETNYKISTDEDTTNKYLKHASISYFRSTMLAVLITSLLLIIEMTSLEDITPIAITAIICLSVIGLMIFKLLLRKDYLRHFLKSEFVLDDFSLTLNIDGQFKRIVDTSKKITIKTTTIGTFVLNGEYSFWDLYLSRYSPIGIPLRYPNDIFIPKLTGSYENLIEKLKRTEISQK